MLLFFLLVLLELHSAKPAMESKVVKGERANITRFAYSAFLMITDTKGTFVCGSSIINQRILLTAGHCIEACDVGGCQNPVAYTGHSNKRKGDMIPILRTVAHEQYDHRRVQNDIGLVMLKYALPLGNAIKRIVIMRKPPHAKFATVAGWGLVNEQQTIYTDYLYSADQMVWSLSECKKMLTRIPNGTFCAGDIKNQRYASQGDSGSALVVNKYIQIGIVSHKRPHISRAIVVYTDVAFYYNWIKNHSRRLYCDDSV